MRFSLYFLRDEEPRHARAESNTIDHCRDVAQEDADAVAVASGKRQRLVIWYSPDSGMTWLGRVWSEEAATYEIADALYTERKRSKEARK